VSPEIAARLDALDIRLMAEAQAYSMFVRGDCLALACRGPQGFASLGSSGMMTAQGLAFLVWREGQPLLVAKESEAPAKPDQVEKIRRFSADLKSALGM